MRWFGFKMPPGHLALGGFWVLAGDPGADPELAGGTV